MSGFSASLSALEPVVGTGQPHERKRFPVGSEVEVLDYSWSDRGGPKEATVRLTGQQASLWTATTLLGKPILLYNSSGVLVWWGRVYSITIGIGDISIGASLDEMANRVAVIYSGPSAGGGFISTVSAFADNLESQAEFGAKELVYSMGDASSPQAAAKRSQILKDLAWPIGKTLFSSEQGAVLTCKGAMEFLDWKIYNDANGIVENVSSGGGSLAVGWALSGTKFIFYQSTIHNMDGHFYGLEAGDRITITGTNFNNTTYTLDSAPGEETSVVSLVATTISFDPSDDILDSAEGFGIFTDNSAIDVTGSGGNSGIHHLKDRVNNGHMRITTALSRAMVAEAPGTSITIVQGKRIAIQETAVDEGAGDSVTIKLLGVIAAQSFVPASNMTVARISLRVAAVGSPGDNLTVGFYTDTFGDPGTQIGTNAVLSASLLAVDSPEEIWFDVPSTVVLTGGVTYWIRVGRSGATSATQFYRLAISETPYGGTRGWNGSSWQTLTRNGVNVSVPFRLEDAEDITVTMERIVTAAGQSFITSFRKDASAGVVGSRFRDASNSALQEMLKLLDTGNSSGDRLTALVSPHGELYVTSQVSTSQENAFLESDNTLKSPAGASWEEGRLPVGEWVAIREIPDSINSAWRLSPFYVESASYNVAQRKLRLVPRGSRKFLELLRGR